jgi:hypothetical protein
LSSRAYGRRPGVRPGGPPKAEPGALTPGQRRRRRRLDPKNGLFRQRSAGATCRAVFWSRARVGPLEQVDAVVVADRWWVIVTDSVEHADGVGLVHEPGDLGVPRPAEG